MTGHVGPRESSLMTQKNPTYEELEARLAELQNRLEQAEQRISALGAPEIERLQQAELNSKAVLDAILEHIPEGITVAARENQAILVESRYALDLPSKKPRREQVSLREGLGTRRMYHADGKTPAQIEELPLWRATMKGEIVKDEEWVLLGRHNQPITLMINAGPIRDSSGNVTGGIAAWRDVTDRKQLEIKLRHREEQFTRMFSINPDPISLACVEADEFIAYAVDGAARMQRLIADLLAYSRVGTRGRALIPADLKRAFERAQADLWTTIVETGAKLTHDPLPVVNGDETQLAQLFLNLIGNAIKFRSERPPEIHVGVKAENDSYLFYVRDNGIGFDHRYAAKIFQVFQRLHTRQKYPGTGIGLAICKKIIDRHGGRIWVESEPGKGSTFYFTLPKAGGEPWK